MSKSGYRAFLLLASCVFLLSACFLPFGPKKPRASRTQISVPSGRTPLKIMAAKTLQGRTVLPAMPSVASYTLSSSTGSGFTKVCDFSSLPGAGSIVPGTYHFLLEAKNSVGNVVLSQTIENVLIGTETANLSFTVGPVASGYGNVDVAVTWSGATVASVDTLFGPLGLSPTLTTSSPAGATTSYVNNSVPYGNHFLTFRLKDGGGKLLASVTEGVRVYQNLTSSKTITLLPGDFNAPPVPPNNLTATFANGLGLLVWTDTSNNETGFEVERSSDGGSSWTSLTGATPLAAGSTSFMDTTVVDGTTDTYRVRSVNGYGVSEFATSGVIYAMMPLTSTSVGDLMGVIGGTFFNGTSNVTVSSFYMSKFEITQERYQALTGMNPSFFVYVNGYVESLSRPVDRVSWYDAIEFCNKASIADGLQPVYVIGARTPASGYPITSATVTPIWTRNGYRLPTEAEWEFAARGGILTHGYTYAGANTIENVSWYSSNSGSTSQSVGGLTPNELGLCDMTGNANEWCWDWLASYPSEPQINPTGPPSGANRVLRGGGWGDPSIWCTVAFQNGSNPATRAWDFGFRVVRSASAQVDSTPPSNPTAAVALAGDANVVLNWTNPADVDFAAVEITWTPAGGSPSQPLSVAIPGATQTITGLANGTSYTFTIRSVDSAGNKSVGATVVGVPLTSISSVSVGNLRPVHAGTFNNGSGDVNLSPFYISETEIGQGPYLAVMGTNPSNFSGELGRPVEMVTWFDAVEFCNKASLADSLQPVYVISGRTPAAGYPITSATVVADWTKNGYRLPTEAEWEFAARGGNSTHNYAYSGSNTIDDVAWYDLNSGSLSHLAGSKAANELGLYDMSGNVWEWCWDWFGSYPGGPQSDPAGPDSGNMRVLRGGSWIADSASATVSNRISHYPNYYYSDFGFRVARTALAQVDTTPPATVASLSSTNGDGQVTLSWTNPSDVDFAGVEVTWTPAGGSPSQPVMVAFPGTSQVITGLSNGTSYTFTAKAVDSAGNKSPGITTIATPFWSVGSIGPAGGVVFYDNGSYDNGWRWLEAAPSDWGVEVFWFEGATQTTGAVGTSIGSGAANTTTIVSVLGGGTYAASVCSDLSQGGYVDWFLPSKDELNALYQNKGIIGGFAAVYYWSSSEFDADTAWCQLFSTGAQDNSDVKQVARRVRAIRAF